jgi:predicted transcriptional regulator
MRKILPNMPGGVPNVTLQPNGAHGYEPSTNGVLRPGDRIGLATEIVTAFVRNNSLPSVELAPLIFSVHDALSKLEKPETTVAASSTPVPAVPVSKSITTDYLICLEDGRRFKSLRRHLKLLGMTPNEYRAKWKLPAEYPMVAPNYAAVRSALAKKIGLGLKVAGKTLGRPRKVVRTPVRAATS